MKLVESTKRLSRIKQYGHGYNFRGIADLLTLNRPTWQFTTGHLKHVLRFMNGINGNLHKP